MTGIILIVSIWIGAAQLDPQGAFGGYQHLPMPEQEIALSGDLVPQWAKDRGADTVGLACAD